MSTRIPFPSFVPPIHHEFNEYMVFDLKFPSIMAGAYLLYYLALEPFAAVCDFLSLRKGDILTHTFRSFYTPPKWHCLFSPPLRSRTAATH